MNRKRPPTDLEKSLIEELAKCAKRKTSYDKQEELLVTNMDNGGMGSLLLYPSKVNDNERRGLGIMVSDCSFKDVDGVLVIASLFVDKEGLLYELDMWKTDFSALIQIPQNFE